MTVLTKIFIESLVLGANVAIAARQADMFDKLHKKIDHETAAFVYVASLTIPWLIVTLSGDGSWALFWLMLSGFAIHFPLFSAALNYFRTPRRPFDYHNTADMEGSKWDLFLGKYYAVVWFCSVAAWISLQFLIF